LNERWGKASFARAVPFILTRCAANRKVPNEIFSKKREKRAKRTRRPALREKSADVAKVLRRDAETRVATFKRRRSNLSTR
jgi:hypothetical protein